MPGLVTYKFRMVHIPAVQHKAADAVSCYPTGPSNPDMMSPPDDIAASGASAIPSLFNPSGHSFLTGICCREPPASYNTIDDELASLVSSSWPSLGTASVATASDTNMVQLMSIIESGFPEFCHELPPALCEHHQFHDHLYTVDGIILYKACTPIPPSFCHHVLTILHSAHQGVTSMTAHAETTLFWPDNPSHHRHTNCHHCNRIAPSQPNVPPFPPVLPAYPFQCTSADFSHYNCCGWQTFKLAHHRTGTSRIQGPNWLFIPDECARNGGPSSPHQSILQGLGSTPLPVICSPPTLKLQSRNWRQNCQTTHHQQQTHMAV